LGRALRVGGYREKAFLMTKIDGRDKVTAANQISESLKRLQSDHIDLLQFHEVTPTRIASLQLEVRWKPWCRRKKQGRYATLMCPPNR
jgi:aryl-alcohol dehydrogenase-like predicted oxidoreductase